MSPTSRKHQKDQIPQAPAAEKKGTKKREKRKSTLREWIDAAIFAVIAATLIRTFFFEAYTIPSPSMEKTLLVHDFLFVNKLSYGPRMPMTPLGVPFTLSTLPVLSIRSYSDWPHFGYHRLPGFGHIQRRDVVVFNFPEGDTVLKEQPKRDYYAFLRTYGRKYVQETIRSVRVRWTARRITSNAV
jgi:signal peptidase I